MLWVLIRSAFHANFLDYAEAFLVSTHNIWFYEEIRKIFTWSHCTKGPFFNPKVLIFFLFLHENICCGYSLDAPCRGTSNEYPQHMFSWRNKKNIYRIPSLIQTYAVTSFYLELCLQIMSFICDSHKVDFLVSHFIFSLWQDLNPSFYQIKILLMLNSTLGKNFSRQHFEVFSYFFQENRLWHFMQIIRWFAWNVKAYLLGKIKKIHFFISWICPEYCTG